MDEPLTVIDDPRRAAELTGLGVELDRHYFRMSLALGEPIGEPPLPAGFSMAPVDVDSLGAYGEIVCRAYASGHPDHHAGDDDPVVAARSIAGYLRGEEEGPWLPDPSCHVIDGYGRIVGVVIISEAVSPANRGMPWVTDVFVDPDVAGRGLGAAMISRAANRLAAANRTTLGLAVTFGNPALRLYQRLGFTIDQEIWRFQSRTAG